MKKRIKIVGGGLAGSEAAYQLLKRGYAVDLYEMRPVVRTAVHKTDKLAELVCSNSLKSMDPASAQGELKRELKLLDSLVLRAAELSSVPAGSALAVERSAFQNVIEKELSAFKNFRVVREEITELEEDAIYATGPLTSDALAESIQKRLGGFLAFYDAVAPIITVESVDTDCAYYAARYGNGSADYLNCPMTKEEYLAFYRELINAESADLHEFEKGELFESCMPVEVMAKRGEDAIRFGPLRPVGLRDPKTDKGAYAVLQLRMEDKQKSLANLVGFQTNLRFGEQERVFRMIPALKNAEFVRYGVMHRNTFLDAPNVLENGLKLKGAEKIFFAGQITGVEGYLESVLSGVLAAINYDRSEKGLAMTVPPEETVSGGLIRYLGAENKNFQPMHVAFELVPPLDERPKDKKLRKQKYADRAYEALKHYINGLA